MDFLSEAFKSLQSLTEETFDLSATDGQEELKDFIDKDDAIDTLTIIDDEAETEEELQDSYMGKVVIDCNVCHSLIYKDPSEIVIDEDGENCNDEEECPYCYSTGDGFKLIGQIKPFGEVEDELEAEEEEESDEDDEIETEDDSEEVEVEDEEEVTEESDDDNEEVEESFKDVIGGKSLAEHIKSLKNNKSLKEGKASISKEKIEMALEDAGIFESCDENESCDKNESRDKNEACEKCGKNPCECDDDLEESIQDMSLTTDDGTTVSMESGESGEVTIKTKPGNEVVEDEFSDDFDMSDDSENIESDEETIGELDQETEDEIIADQDENASEDKAEEGSEGNQAKDESEEEVTDFDEETFEEMGESYLKKTYSNVESYKVSSVGEKGNKLFVEGLIKFKSGNVKKTNFVFESKGVTKTGKVVLEGFNKEITGSNKAFRLTGKIDNSKFLSESLNYRYNQNKQTIKGKITR